MSDFFVSDDEKKKEKSVNVIPKSYLPIKLSSNGKLGAPSKIHVRNYSGQDALDLAMSDETNMLESLLTVLDNMIYEDIDVYNFHEQDIEEIMLNIYFNFWKSSIEYPYIVPEDELKTLNSDKRKAIEDGLQKYSVNIDSKSIKTKTLKDFKEPLIIQVEDSEDTYGFNIPRIGHDLIAKEKTEDKFEDEEDEFYELSEQLQHNQDNAAQGKSIDYKIKPSQVRKFKKYQMNRLKFFTLQKQLLMIDSVNGKTIDEKDKVQVYNEIPLTVWKEFNTQLKETIKFGVQHDIKVISPVTQKEVTRRFQFRFLDFLPSMDT